MIGPLNGIIESCVAKHHRLWFFTLLTVTGLLAVYTALNSTRMMNYREILFMPVIRNETTSVQQGTLRFASRTQLIQFINTQLPVDATIVLIGSNAASGIKRDVVHLAHNIVTDPKSLATALNDIHKPYIFFNPSSLRWWQDGIAFVKAIHGVGFPHRYLQFVFRAEPVIAFRYMNYSDRELFVDNSLTLAFGADRLLSQYANSLRVEAVSKSARCVQRGEKTGDALAYTPRVIFPVGQHSVDIFLSQDEGAAQGDVALLDVFANGKRQSSLIAYKSDFLQENHYQRFTLEFIVEQENEPLEARVFYLGSTNLCVQGIRFLP